MAEKDDSDISIERGSISTNGAVNFTISVGRGNPENISGSMKVSLKGDLESRRDQTIGDLEEEATRCSGIVFFV